VGEQLDDRRRRCEQLDAQGHARGGSTVARQLMSKERRRKDKEEEKKGKN
jgi:hypothetical protein